MSKTVLVTGSAKGIGRELIWQFAKNGYNVIIHYLTSEKEAYQLEREIKQNFNVKTYVIKADITNELALKRTIDDLMPKVKKIDILVNNASYSCDDYYFEKTKEEFMRVLEVNVVGTFLVTKHVSKYMDNGVVVNISSLDASKTYRDISMDYCASKAGVNSLAQSFSLALPNNKIISVMLPWVDTESVREMDPNYLKEEMTRVGQEKLLSKEEAALKIIDIVNDSNIQSGSIVAID